MLSPDGKLEVAVPLSGKDLACQPSVTTINIKQEVMENVSQLAVAPNPSSLKRFIDRMKEVTSGIKALETIAQWVCLLLAP